MTRTSTQFKKAFKLLGKAVLLTVLGIISYSSYGQYTTPNHRGGACFYTTNGYAAIEQVQITDQSGTVLYNKAADGPNQCHNGYGVTLGHYNVIESTSQFTLSAGATYTVSVSTSNKYTWSTNNSALGIWFDFNGDQDFADADEFITPNNNNQPSGSNSNPSTLTAYSFTVPCGGTTGVIRMRIRSDYQTYYYNAAGHSLSGNRPYYGETEDFACSYAVPTGLSSNFFSPTTAFVGTVVNFTNSNQSGYISHNWTIDGTPSSSTNAEHIFGTTGTYSVKLVSENCLGKDSTTKTITIINPTAPPVSNFISNKNTVEIFEPVKFTDLSTNGPTFWDWIFVKGTDTIDGDDQFNLRGGDPYTHKNPSVQTGNYTGALDIGTWQVCLKASNAIPGSSYTCKMGYITVQQSSYNMGAQTTLPQGIITTSSGVLFDKGGISGNYPSGGSTPETQEALIAPCGAQSVSLNFSTFQVKSNVTLRIYDGTNALGTPLHTGNGFTDTDDATSIGTITANSGAMYLLWVATSGPNDEGFAASWTSVTGTGATPTAAITMPGTTLYNAVSVDFMNASINAEGNTSRLWTITGPVGASTTVTYTTKDLENYTFLANGAYTITLEVTTCDNQSSSVTESFTVAAPNSPTQLDFTADNRRPSTGEEITFTATSDKANKWEWSVFPATGYTKGAVNANLPTQSYTFSAAGVYTVQCVAYNSSDQAASETTVVKTGYVIVVQHCTPIIGVTTSADVGISYVSITNPLTNQDLLINEPTPGTAYTDYSDLGAVDVNFGGTYNFTVKRPTNVNPMSRQVWIDWNVDGDFDDAGESTSTMVEGTANTASWTGSFTVPDATTAFEATTRMRIGVSYDTDPNEPCGAGTNPAANRVGQFVDYAIRVVNDGDIPVITLNGDATVYIEQSTTPNYVSDSAVVMDPSQGDITENLVITSDLDQTLPGVYFEVYNAKDASGNFAEEVTRLVYVVSDQTAPEITVNAAIDTTIEVGTPWVDLGASALDNKEGVLTDAIVITGSVDENLLGTYTITYSVKDNQGNASSATRTVHVVDTELPIIDNASADKSGACWTVDVQLQNIFADITNATDNYNSLGSGLTLKASPAAPQGGAAVDTRFQGTTTVTYTATDESGNKTTQCVDYVVRDYIAPVINLRTLDVVTHPVGSIYTPVAPTAADNLYSSSEISLVLTSTDVDGFTLGTYTDVYTATDAAGNSSTAIRTVKVTDEIAPTITGKRGPIVKIGVGSQVSAIDYVLFADNYESRENLIANHTLVFNDLNLQEAGLYSVVFNTTDNSGNKSADFMLYFDVAYKYLQETNSVNDLSLEDLIAVSPNPTSGLLNIEVNLPENEVINLAIFNTVGQEVLNVTDGKVSNGNYSVDLSNNANGIYYVKMNVKGAIVTKKIVLNN